MSDFDSPWKEALDIDFRAFLEFFFPKVAALIDWTRGFESLDKELQKIVRESNVGRRYVDKLVKAWLRNGQEAWLLIHVEFQAQYDPGFPERMFVYNYRLYDRHRRPVISLAILGDDEPNWRPNRFGYSQSGSTMVLKYPMVKLLDYDLEALESNANPFALFALAHLKTLETRRDTGARRVWKFRVIRGLYERGYTADEVRQWFRVIDWLMALPKELDEELTQELSQFEEEKQMPYITSVERLGQEKGEVKGKAEMLLNILQWRYAVPTPEEVETKIRSTKDQNQLDQWAKLAVQAGSLEEFRQLGQL